MLCSCGSSDRSCKVHWHPSWRGDAKGNCKWLCADFVNLPSDVNIWIYIVEKIIHWHVYIFTMHHPWRDTWHMTGRCGALVLGQAPPSLTGRTYTVCLWEDMKIGQSEIPCHSSISSCYSSFIRLVVHPLLFCPCSASSPPLSLSLCLCQHMMRHVGDHPQVCCSANWANITD